MNHEGYLWLDVVDHFNQLTLRHVPSSVELVELHFEVVNPVVQNIVLNVLFAERFTHSVYEVAPRLSLDIHQFRQLQKV